MKEYTIETSCKTEGDFAHLVVLLYEGRKVKDSADRIKNIAKWLATINFLTNVVNLCEYRIDIDGEEVPEKVLEYKETSFVDWELLDQSVAMPLSLKHRIAEVIQVYY